MFAAFYINWPPKAQGQAVPIIGNAVRYKLDPY